MGDSNKKLGIKGWAKEDRPREKLLMKGRNSLSDAEILAILIGSGNQEESAVDLSRRILKRVDNNLNELARFSTTDFQKFKGIGEAKAISIVSALELGKRRQRDTAKAKPQITQAADVYNYMSPLLMDLPHEAFWMLMLDRSNKVVGEERISTGGVSGTVVDVKVIFKYALEKLASSVILCHNHPSGNLEPSQADRKITRKVKEAGELLEIQVLDHVIVTADGYYSFADEGEL
jgi:DNA repair protein RadC